MWWFSPLGELFFFHSPQAPFSSFYYRLGDARSNLRKICGEIVAQKCKPIWGLDKEGEVSGVWRDLGVKGLWYMVGTLHRSTSSLVYRDRTHRLVVLSRKSCVMSIPLETCCTPYVLFLLCGGIKILHIVFRDQSD